MFKKILKRVEKQIKKSSGSSHKRKHYNRSSSSGRKHSPYGGSHRYKRRGRSSSSS